MTARVLARAAFASVLAAGAFPGLAHAETIIALTNDNRLLTFDSATPGTASAPFAVTGLQNNEALLDIDIRPADLQLYAVSNQGRVYRVNTTTGVATLVSTLSADAGDATSPFTSLNSDTRFGIDFNPAADRLRIVGNQGENYRVNVDTGATITDTNFNGAATGAVGVGYSNNDQDSSTPTTTFYVNNLAPASLFSSNNPNGGVLASTGPLGFAPTSNRLGFDISGSGQAFLTAVEVPTVGDINTRFYTVNSTTGAATFVGIIGPIGAAAFQINGIAAAPAVPAPGALALAALGAMLSVRRRR